VAAAVPPGGSAYGPSVAVIEPSEDAFGQALLDVHRGRSGPPLILERDDGWSGPAVPASFFFEPYEAWPAWERRAIDRAQGAVLDLGAGAGRHAVHLQERRHEVTTVDWSSGAVEVCRRRGVRDARLADIDSFDADRTWDTFLLMCGNLGLGGDWEPSRGLLRRLADMASDDAVLIGDSVDPASDDPDDVAYERGNARAGFHRGHIRLRLRYGETLTPWWDQLNVPPDDVAELVRATGWRLELHERHGEDHVVVLRRHADN
jgi:SAM-dependent methyltransferase